ncbi:hypothetical protein [Archaeoglobus sp.]
MTARIPLVRGYLLPKGELPVELINFIEIGEKKVLKCPNCDEEIEFEDNSPQLPICRCGKRVRPSEKHTRVKRFIRNVHYSKILEEVKHKVGAIAPTEIDKDRMLLKVHYNGKSIYVIFPEISNFTYVLHENMGKNCIFVYLDHRRSLHRLTLWKQKAYYLLEFLKQDVSKIEDLLQRITRDIPTSPEKSVEIWFDKVVSGWNEKKKPYNFEKFVVNLFKDLRETLPEFLATLHTQYGNTLLNSKVVKIGGPGMQDFQIINLYDYLSSIKPERYGEVKAYFKGKFTVDDYSEGLRHAKEGDLLMVTATNNIAPSVWKDIIEMRERKGYYKHVLIDRELLLLLISLVEDRDRLLDF